MSLLLEARGVTAGYGDADILHDVGIEVRSGETVAIVGANGSGKSTLLKAVAGVVQVRSGSITFDGKPVQNVPPHRITAQGLSYVPQVRSTFPSLTVEENLQIAAEALGRRKARPDEAYRVFPQLEASRRKRAGLLSGGGRQMLGIAMGLVGEPSLLLLDEPTAALSPKLAQLILERIAKEIVPRGVTVLIVEQRVQDVLEIADRAYVMADGRVVREAVAGSVSERDLIDLFLGGAAA
jgi:ABC-type branched-subunit amino acid transport system ATPase component